MSNDFRFLILERLKKRDNKCRIFERIFNARMLTKIFCLIKF